jgi:hypothetical protein
VSQFEELVTTVLPQRVDQTPWQPAARVDSHARRLVDDQQVGVFVDNRVA